MTILPCLHLMIFASKGIEKGHRIGIETVLYEYLFRDQSPEAIQRSFPTLTLEQVYATILYYLHNRSMVEQYLTDWLEYGRQARAEQQRNPPPIVTRLRALRAQSDPVAVDSKP